MAEKSSPFLQMNATPPTRGRKFSRKLGILIGVVLLAILAVSICYRYLFTSLLFDAVVNGTTAVVTAPANGQVLEISVGVNEVVSLGQPLLRLDTTAPESPRDAATQAQLKTLEDQVNAAEQIEEEARGALKEASRIHASALVALRGVPHPRPGDTAAGQVHGKLQADERSARAALEAARIRLETASSARYVAQNAYRQMRSALGANKTQPRSYAQQMLVVGAPMAGRIQRLDAEPGSYVTQGQPLAMLAPALPEQFWVSAFAHQRDLSSLKPGKLFRLRFPDHPQLELTGAVESIDANTSTEEAGVPVRLRLIDYDPISMPMLVFGQQVETKEK